MCILPICRTAGLPCTCSPNRVTTLWTASAWRKTWSTQTARRGDSSIRRAATWERRCKANIYWQLIIPWYIIQDKMLYKLQTTGEPPLTRLGHGRGRATHHSRGTIAPAWLSCICCVTRAWMWMGGTLLASLPSIMLLGEVSYLTYTLLYSFVFIFQWLLLVIYLLMNSFSISSLTLYLNLFFSFQRKFAVFHLQVHRIFFFL